MKPGRPNLLAGEGLRCRARNTAQIPVKFEIVSSNYSVFFRGRDDILIDENQEKAMEVFVGIMMVVTILAVIGKVVLAFRIKPRTMTPEQGTFQLRPRSSRTEFGKRKPEQGMQ